MSEKRFNIRVYGIIINDKDEVLLSDERRFGMEFTKFPGGGLHWGEGLADAVIRELQEEIGIDVEVVELLYVNSFFQASAFNENDQLMSFYYYVEPKDWTILHAILSKQDPEGEEVFRWMKMRDLSEETFRFPIDQIVGGKLQHYSSMES